MKVSNHKKGSVQKQLIYEINYTFLLYLIFFSIRFFRLLLEETWEYSKRRSSSRNLQIAYDTGRNNRQPSPPSYLNADKIFFNWLFVFKSSIIELSIKKTFYPFCRLFCLRHLTFWFSALCIVCVFVDIERNKRFIKIDSNRIGIKK